jgi:peroxiredoxin
LAAFARAQDRLVAEGITTVAGSTDPVEKARETVAEQALTFPVGYGLPLKDTARALGAFYDPQRGILHATGFVIRPDRRIALAQYSSGPIGRLVWQDVLGLVQFFKGGARKS